MATRLHFGHVKARRLLDAHWPGAKQLFFRPASKIALAFLAEFPTRPSTAPSNASPPNGLTQKTKAAAVGCRLPVPAG